MASPEIALEAASSDRADLRRLDGYQDLVFSPLALAEPPAMEADRLISWMQWANGLGRKSGRNASERGYESRTGRAYPWLLATVAFAEPGAIERSFAREFPELLEYAAGFPIHGVGCINFLAQRDHAEVFVHTDSDGFWGLRFYLSNRNREGLHFCMARKRVPELPRGSNDWSSLLRLEEKHYARWPERNTPYCLNSIRAGHAVDADACALGERIACVLAPANGYDRQRLLTLLEESTEQFRDYQIWYKEKP